MTTDRRVNRLKHIADRIEQLPASAGRDRLLGEVRSRAVDLETGVTPRAMLPIRELPEPVVAPKLARLPVAPAARPATPHPASYEVDPIRRRAPIAGGSPGTLGGSYEADDVLSLEDSGALALSDHRQGRSAIARPWTLGLRD